MDVERLFLRYRSTGDAEALGRVFDRVAPALLRIGRHVGGSRETAQDLVQATFLTAMEKASSYDPARPLTPWLTGILLRHAAWMRRTGGRTPDPARVDLPLPRDPADLVSEAEVERAVDRALAALPDRYRPLVEARLLHGARGVDLARRTGRSPGVVRMQLHRGLELLKRALPASLVPSLAFLFWSRRALAATRAEVLAHAGAPGTAAAAPVLLGGMLVAHKTLLTAGLILAAGAAWLLSRDSVPLAAPETTPPVVLDTERARAVFPVVTPERAAAARSVDAPLPADEPGEDGQTAAFPPSYVAALSGVTGRLVEADGAAVADADVALVEARPGELMADLRLALGDRPFAPRIEAARATTGDDGTFTLVGAHARGVHALLVDPGGPRAALRLLDVALRPGAVTDLGDVVLAPGVALTGRVVGEDGAPIAGARVRASPLPFPIATVGAEHWTPEARVARLRSDPARHAVVRPPAWVGAQVDRLPFATTTTGADGRFVLERVARGAITIVVDAADRPAHVFGPVPSGTGSARDAGALVLPQGRTLEGVVLDADGAPVAGAAVVAGSAPPLGRLAVLPHETVTGGDGRFRVGPLPEDAAVVVAARRTPADGWTCVGPSDDETVTVALPPTGSLAVGLNDASGAPVRDAAVRIRPHVDLDELSDHLGPGAGADAVRRDDGRHVFDALAVGRYRLAAAGPSFGIVHRSVAVAAGENALEVRLDPVRTLEVRVVDERSGDAVEHARLTLFSSLERPALAAARTGADGCARLGPTTDDGEAWTLRVEHPGYATAYRPVDPGAGEVVVRIDGGGALLARVSARGNPPREPLTVHLRHRPFGEVARHLLDEGFPWLATTDARGDVFFPRLPAGRFVYEVHPAALRADGLPALDALDPSSPPLRRGEVEVTTGETTELRVELAAEDVPPSGVRGRVTVDGTPAPARVQLAVTDAGGETVRRSVVTGDDGRFDLADLPAGEARLTVALEDGPSTGLAFEDRFALAPGVPAVHDVALRTRPVPVRVTKDGRPVEGARVWGKGARGGSQWTRSDARGDAPLRAFAPGPLAIRVEHALGIGRAEVDVPEDGRTARVEVALEDGIPFAGTFTLDGALAAAGGPLALRVTFYDGSLFASRTVPLDEDARRFRVLGLEPGSFWVELRAGDVESERIELELDASGSETLAFEFEAE